MKKILWILFAIAFCHMANAANLKPISIKKDYVEFSSNLYVSKWEITNLEYNEFLQDIKTSVGVEEYSKCQPDTTRWLDRCCYNEPYVSYYHSHPAYRQNPAVNIDKESMEKYCAWLTSKYNATPKREFKKVVFRLPSEQEWMKFSSPLPDQRLPWHGDLAYLVDSKDKIVPMANVKTMNYATGKYDFVGDNGFIPVVIGTYKSNKLGLFDIIGNVAEMTSDGKVKGGSWDNTIEECFIDKEQNITLPDPRVGFRIVMEIIEK